MISDDPGPSQRRDPVSGLVQPWYTHGALDEIQSWDVREKTVLEWGGGFSTLWWASRCKWLHTIDGDEEWVQWIRGKNPGPHVTVTYAHSEDADGNPNVEYTCAPSGYIPDIVIIDGVCRTLCLESTLALPRPLTIIIDNWQQDYVYICAKAEAMMAPFKGTFYVQPDHVDHEGKPWQTAIWHLERP